MVSTAVKACKGPQRDPGSIPGTSKKRHQRVKPYAFMIRSKRWIDGRAVVRVCIILVSGLGPGGEQSEKPNDSLERQAIEQVVEW